MILKYYKSMFFNENSILALKGYSNLKLAYIFLFLTVLFQSLPLTYEEILTTHITYFNIFLKFFSAILILFFISKVLKSKTEFHKFLFVISFPLLLASILTAILSYLSLFIFEFLLNNNTISNLVTSILPYYLIALFAFTADIASDLSSLKSSLIGILAVILLYYFYFFL